MDPRTLDYIIAFGGIIVFWIGCVIWHTILVRQMKAERRAELARKAPIH